MRIEWIEDFVALAESGSFAAAARKRNVTHPAFGRRVKALENWLGAVLVDRAAYPARLTAEGERFLAVARETAGRLTGLREEFRAARQARGKRVTVAAGRTLARAVLPRLIERLGAGAKAPSVQVITASLHDGLALIADGGADFLLCFAGKGTRVDLDPDRYRVATVARGALVPVSAPGAKGRPLYAVPRAGDPVVPFLAYGAGLSLGAVLTAELDRRGLWPSLEPVFEADLAEAVMEMALRGRGLGWLPDVLASPALAERKLVRAEPPGHDPELAVLLYRRDDVPPSADRIWRKLIA